ncbi:hypothetical protein P280DRAFT_303071 [Massarina eburnea CBS 473.64]|uniref:Uncharacterized protein n=1 Tax=Massarina eburnea CBS 473.64 TaxID=1395130 RepID=A0A6A6S3X5_9PLEO|nr:hypothetical protein P280DRAFT_303071 [Massarina eburnea CBS 473.64]
MANPFFQLSPELRNMVYDNLFAKEEATPVDNKLAIFMISHNLHLEASTYFYARHHRAFDMRTVVNTSATMLPPMADAYVRFLKHVDISMPAGCASSLSVQQTARRLTALTAINANLEMITFHIGRADGIPTIMNNRLNDSVLDMSHPLVEALRQILNTGTSKKIRIRLSEAWLAKGVGAELRSAFGARIEFVEIIGDKLKPVVGLSQLERQSKGFFMSSPLKLFSDDVGSDIDPSNPSPPDSGVSLLSFLSLESDVLPTLLNDMDFGTDDIDDADDEPALDDSEESLSDLEDMDLDEELEPINEAEAAQITTNFMEMETEMLGAEANASSVRILTIMAPDYL